MPEEAGSEYEALFQDVGFLPLPRNVIEITGDDRTSFLHNLCTNEVNAIGAGEGREAFVTNVQGKTIGHITYAVDDRRILIHTVPDQGEFLINHLDRYLITEDVQLADRTDALRTVLVAGPRVFNGLVESSGSDLNKQAYANSTIEIEGIQVFVQSLPIVATNCLLVMVAPSSYESLIEALVRKGMRPVSPETLDVARIENGYPLFGIDITDNNLPQEVARDELAISFIKGCYLGQETIARIDALGHVNRILTQLRFEGENVPETGSEIIDGDGKSAGAVTSACYSPKFQSPIGLAFVHCKSLEQNELTCGGHRAQGLSATP